MSCVFCSILAGRTEAHFVFADDEAAAFLDARPLFKGHTLLVPREHHETLADLPPALVEPVFSRARVLSMAMEDALDATGSFVAMNNRVSQSVPHLHLHVVPRRHKDGMRGFFWPRTSYDDEADEAGYAARLAQSYERLVG
jgi:histidine triad (HIT) family protein